MEILTSEIYYPLTGIKQTILVRILHSNVCEKKFNFRFSCKINIQFVVTALRQVAMKELPSDSLSTAALTLACTVF